MSRALDKTQRRLPMLCCLLLLSLPALSVYADQPSSAVVITKDGKIDSGDTAWMLTSSARVPSMSLL